MPRSRLFYPFFVAHFITRGKHSQLPTNHGASLANSQKTDSPPSMVHLERFRITASGNAMPMVFSCSCRAVASVKTKVPGRSLGAFSCRYRSGSSRTSSRASNRSNHRVTNARLDTRGETLSVCHRRYLAGIGFVKGKNTRSERWDFAAYGDHLYATRNDQNEDATAAGKHIKSSRTVWYVRK